jgi:hypothetical protein
MGVLSQLNMTLESWFYVLTDDLQEGSAHFGTVMYAPVNCYICNL